MSDVRRSVFLPNPRVAVVAAAAAAARDGTSRRVANDAQRLKSAEAAMVSRKIGNGKNLLQG